MELESWGMTDETIQYHVHSYWGLKNGQKIKKNIGHIFWVKRFFYVNKQYAIMIGGLFIPTIV